MLSGMYNVLTQCIFSFLDSLLDSVSAVWNPSCCNVVVRPILGIVVVGVFKDPPTGSWRKIHPLTCNGRIRPCYSLRNHREFRAYVRVRGQCPRGYDRLSNTTALVRCQSRTWSYRCSSVGFLTKLRIILMELHF